MKTISKLRASLFFFLFLFLFISHSHAIQLTLVNTCDHSIWPGIQGSTGTADVAPSDGGFHLPAGEEAAVNVPNGWSGRIWARQGCCFDERGHGFCQTGDCGGKLHCRGSGGAPPATLVEMTFGVNPPVSPVHFYDVSLVDGFNLPVKMAAVGDGGGGGGGGYVCGEAGCKVNVNGCCPSRFEVRAGEKTVGCKSACLALQTDKYCCRGEYGSASSCRPTLFSYIFKALCPRAYTFAYDDAASLVTCRASRYVITFCPGA